MGFISTAKTVGAEAEQAFTSLKQEQIHSSFEVSLCWRLRLAKSNGAKNFSREP
jgi:hypothetical protein